MLFTFWQGPVTWFERLCFASAVAVGHKLTVYSYKPISDLPPGVAVGDAEGVLPATKLFRHRRSGSLAMFSDLFRYEGLRRGLGTWVDADIFFLRPLATADIILTRGGKNHISNAVLRLPPDHPFLAEIRRLSESRVVMAAHWPLKTKLHQVMRICIGRPMTLPEMRLATFGPPALTWYVRRHGLEALALPPDTFSPLVGPQVHYAFNPEIDIEQFFTSNTLGVHLLNSEIAHRKSCPPPSGSFLARMCEKHRIQAAPV